MSEAAYTSVSYDLTMTAARAMVAVNRGISTTTEILGRAMIQADPDHGLDPAHATVPVWYPYGCAGFDLIVAGYLISLASGTAVRPK